MFDPIERSERLSDKVAQQLLESIVTQRMEPGTRLPSERELGDQFGVSRTVIREAVRHLAAKGVLEVRTGSGVRVAHMDSGSVTDSMQLFLRRQGLSYDQVNEVRMTIELETARLAAARAEPEDVAGLMASCGRLEGLADEPMQASMEDVEFHRLVARATHNPLFLVLLDSIGDVLLDIRRATLGIKGRVALASRHHRRISNAIAAHDAEAAVADMQAHLDESEHAWQHLESRTAAQS